jgi:hypothetical protein
MANHEKHLSNHRSAQQRVNAAAVFKVPGGATKLDARLPTEQLAAVLAGLKVIDMRLAKARKAGNHDKVKILRAVQARQQGHAQRLSDLVVAQWERDDKWHNSNADVGTLLAQPRYRNGKERQEAIDLSSAK